MPTHTFTVKIKTGRRTGVEVSALCCAYNDDKLISFQETESKMSTPKMEQLIEASVEKTIGAWIDKENFETNNK